MRKYVTITLFLVCLGLSTQVNHDSLWAVWNNDNQADTSRLNAINTIVWDNYLFTKPIERSILRSWNLIEPIYIKLKSV